MPIPSLDAVQPPMAHYASALAAASAPERASRPAWALVDDGARPTPAAPAIVDYAASALHLERPFAPTESNAYRLSPEAFAAFKRPAEVERKGPAALAAFDARWGAVPAATRRTLLDAFAAAGAFADAEPSLRAPQVVALFSATVPDTRSRVEYLAQQVKTGSVRIGDETKIYLLGGKRPLFSGWTEPESVLQQAPDYQLDPDWQPPVAWPTTEIEATELAWAQQLLPSALRAADVRALPTEAPASRQPAHGGDVASTLVAQFNVAPRSTLLVSTAPFVEHHVPTTRLALKRRGLASVEVAGMGAASPGYWAEMSAEHKLGVLFDNLADVFAVADELRAP